MAKRVTILGSTGSIGRSALDVVASLDGEVEVAALAAYRNAGLLVEQAKEFRPAVVAVGDGALRSAVEAGLRGEGIEVLAGDDAASAVAALAGADVVISAIVGFAGLKPTLAAVRAGKDVALANKEALVAGGKLVREAQKIGGGRIFPLDSEHAALSQCLEGRAAGGVKRLILTASGGPFWGRSPGDVASATPAEALAHPVWTMGAKITVDSATLMNKGLEVIEAHWLFGMDWDKIDVLIHPQSVVHSLVEMMDGSYLAQLAVADMRLPIQYALTYPERRAVRFGAATLDLAAIGRLDFARPDAAVFPCFALALAAGRAGGLSAAAMSAANEVAVERFLAGEIPFGAIAGVISAALEQVPGGEGADYEEIAAADGLARRRAADAAAGFARR